MRVDVAPMTVEQILRTHRRHSPLVIGYLLEALLVGARKLWPEFAPSEPRKPLMPAAELEPKPQAPKPWLPAWRRREGDGGQSLVEYSLILAAIAVVAIIVLLFLGQQVSSILSSIAGAL